MHINNRSETLAEKKMALENPFKAAFLKAVIGIDFGATHIRGGIISMGVLGEITQYPTPSKGNEQEVWEAIKKLITDIIKEPSNLYLSAICIGVPSVVDVTTGTVYNIQHIPACKELPLGKLIEEHFKVPAYINNDANVFTLGEFYFSLGGLLHTELVRSYRGEEIYKKHLVSSPIYDEFGEKIDERPVSPDGAASYFKSLEDQKNKAFIKDFKEKGKKTLLGITIGTGLGAGLILEGKLYNGKNCGAGEIGCIPYLDSNIERYVSGSFFNQKGRKGSDWYQLALKGNAEAIELYQIFGHHLGQAIKIAMYCYDPDKIILGGSVAKAFPLYQTAMFNAMEDFYYPGSLENIDIYPSDLDYSGILGAAALYYEAQRSRGLEK